MGNKNKNQENASQENASQENASSRASVPTMPEAFKETPALADFKSVEALGEAFVNLKQYQGSSIHIPGEDAGEDAVAEFNAKLADVQGVMLKPDFNDSEQSSAFFKTLGAPDDAEGYVFDPIDGYVPNEDKMKAFKDLAMHNNLTKTQASRMAKTMMEQDMASAKGAKEAMESNVASLKADWGQAFDQNTQLAVSVAKATGAPDDVVEAMSNGQADVNFTKWMHSLANKFKGEGQHLLENEEKSLHSTPDEIRDQISDIMNNKQHAYYDNSHPDHSRALDKMIALQRKLAT